jgi:MoxR-like ATPase
MATAIQNVIVSTEDEMNQDTVRAKFNQLEKEINLAVLEREEVTRSALIALLTRSNMLQLGDPGTAKSYITKILAQSFGLNYFQYLLGKNMDPAELFGPVSMPEFKKGNFVRNTVGKLPNAHIAFLDETFKGSTAILNSLLTISNERLYDDGSGLKEVPLQSLFGASNEMPQEDSLAALYDRFLLRHDVTYLSDSGNFIAMLGGKHNVDVTTSISLDELQFAQSAIDSVNIPKSILGDMNKLKKELEHSKIFNSDRRWLQAMPLLRANAWLSGRSSVETDDYSVLRHVLWTVPQQIEEVRHRIEKIIDPKLDRARQIFNEAKADFVKCKEDSTLIFDTGKKFGEYRTRLGEVFAKTGGKVQSIEQVENGKMVTTFEFIGGNVAIGRMMADFTNMMNEVQQMVKSTISNA